MAGRAVLGALGMAVSRSWTRDARRAQYSQDLANLRAWRDGEIERIRAEYRRALMASRLWRDGEED
jgi:hypothetical protein